MLRGSTLPNRSRVEPIPRVVASAVPFTPAGVNPTAIHGNDRTDNFRHVIVAGLLARRKDSSGSAIVASEAQDGSPGMFRDAAGILVEFDLSGLARTMVARFRHHPHINNVLTHICGAQWERIGRALRVILDPRATADNLSPLARNIVELMCAERGVTGRILKPYFHASLAAALPSRTAAYLRAHVEGLFLQMEGAPCAPPAARLSRPDDRR